mgnify:CR=1 FL=1
MKLKHLIKTLVLLITILHVEWVLALPKCNAVFPGGVSTFNNSEIILRKQVVISDTNSGELFTSRINNQAGNGAGNQPSCGAGQTCRVGGEVLSAAQAATIPNVTNNGSTSTLPSNLNGDYFIKNNAVFLTNEITVSGPSRIFIDSSNGGVSFLSILNNVNLSGSASNLSIFINGNVQLNTAITVKAFLFATGNINTKTT